MAGAGMQGLAQAVQTIATLALVPILLGAWGPDGLGLWFAALSLVGAFGFVQCALGGAVIATIVQAESRAQIAAAVRSGAVLAGFVAIATMPVAAIAGAAAAWWTGVPDFAALVVTIVLGFGLVCVAQIPRFVLIGLKRGASAHAIEAVAAIAAALAVFAALRLDGSPWMVAATFIGARALVAFVPGLWILVRKERLALALTDSDAIDLEQPGHDGRLLAVQGAAHGLTHHGDVVLIAVLVGPADAAIHAVLTRLFALPGLIVSFIGLALWPHLAQADGQGDLYFVKRIYGATLALSLAVAGLCVLVLLLCIDALLAVWLGPSVVAPDAMVWGMAAWCLIAAIVVPTSDLLKALGALKLLARLCLTMAAINAPLTIMLIVQFGAAGAIWGSVIAYAVGFVLPAAIAVPARLGQSHRQVAVTSFP